MEDEEYKKLPAEERCVHKLWKARVSGYEEVTKLFRQIDDEKSPEFAKYLGLIKKFVTDSNAMGQEKGLEATLAFVENYAHAGKTVGEVMSGIVTKCMAAPKTRTRELALQVTLMYIEIEKYDAVVEELVKGMELKNPKIVAACINAVTTALREFGSKVINVKPLVKKITPLFGERDKAVRDEARLMVIEIYRWIGSALRSQFNNLQPVQVTELETEFSKIQEKKAVPTRYLRSQQEKQAKIAAETVEDDGVEDEAEDVPATIDPYDLCDPVDILSKLPKDFYDKIEAKKWQERKEALEAVDTLIKAPKFENGDYGDLVRALKKVIQKDSNVIVVALAGKCLAGLATGLKKRFQPYASACVSTLLEKFKEKKQNVVTAIKEAIDALYLSTTLEAILEDVLEALNNKNPSVKAETASFLTRAFSKTAPTALNKKLLKAITGGLIKNVNEPDPTVRDCSAEALGTLMKLVGDKAIGPFLIELEKDNLKMTKIRECCEKAVITVKIPGMKKERPVTAPLKTVEPPKQVSAPKPAKRPLGSAPSKKRVLSDLSGTATIVKSKGNKISVKVNKTTEREIGEDEAVSIVSDILSEEILSGLADSNWKNRLSAVEEFMNQITAMDSTEMPTQAFVRIVNKKPGLKDTNFQVLKARLDVVKYLATNCIFTTTTADVCIPDIVEKLGDTKNGTAASETLTAIAEATNLNYVSELLLDIAFTQKSPKVMQEALTWLSAAIKEFGLGSLNSKLIIDNAKKALSSTNPGVRQSSIQLFGTLYLYLGPSVHMHFENEKSTIKDQISVEFSKYENEKPPIPTRGIFKEENTPNMSNEEYDDVGSGDNNLVNTLDLLPRADISTLITDNLINELSDKNWKVRNEALVKLSTIIVDAKLIKPNIGDLPQALASRLVDSNGKIAQTALNICENMATAMGPPCRQHIRVLFPGFLQGLGDGKSWIRSASLATINAFGEQCGYKDFFEGEMIVDALKTGSPTLRSELWGWLSEKLPKIKTVPKEELMICIPHLYTNLEDRSADVRKNAQEAVFGFMIHLGYETMAKQTEKLKPCSKTVVLAALDKVRPNLPIKPLKKQPVVEKEEKAVRGTKPAANAKNAVKPKGAAVAKPASARKKEEDVDTSPLLVISNMKHQRTIDESKMKVLKWNFNTPREEFVELLKEQMLAANVNRTLVFNMFHSDFRYHIKAIESLMEDLPDNSSALISNLDLILKWLTLRFFDTNPSVLLKGLEYLHSVFNMLIENQYHLLENEASSFIPYLILKIGDPKDSVRNGVRSLFRQICYIYAVSKLFSYIMEGLKSKNARQRAECLEVMGSIIDDYGITVCLPSPAACLKEVAKQISDRDNSVRNAALNCIVQAYYVVGEKVYKMVGQISDKDMSLLEERIKRSNKKLTPKVAKTDSNNVTVVASGSPNQRDSSPVKNNIQNCESDEEVPEEEEEDNLPPIVLPSQIPQENIKKSDSYNATFKLDAEFMKELDSVEIRVNKLKLQEFDLGFFNEKIMAPTLSEARAKIMPLSPPKPVLPNQSFTSRSNLSQRQGSPRTGHELLLEKTINQIGSPDIPTTFKAIEQLQEILQSPKGSQIIDYEDQFMTAVSMQLKLLHSKDPKIDDSISKVYRALLTVLDAFYRNNALGRKVSTDVLQDIINQLIVLLVEAKLESCPNADAYIRVVNLHCVKIIERSDHTNIICALIKLLHYCINNDGSARFTDLVMKCLWRVIKIMPNWTDEIDYDYVLLDVHNFLKDFPTAWWKNKTIDTPLRTIKTILHSSAKIKGGSLMLHLGKIPNTNDSETEAYILRLLKSLKLEEVKQLPLKTETATRRPLSRSTHNLLTDIFQKIGSKEETKEGLTLLYDFLQQHPEADIEPFLKRSSKFFQDYIKKGLQEIEDARKKSAAEEKIEEKVAESMSGSTSENAEGMASEYWRDRLKMWGRILDQNSSGND